MRLRLVTPPASEPVTLAEAKAHLRFEDSTDDTYITALIQAARENAEAHCWRGFVTQTWEAVLHRFPDFCGPSLQNDVGGRYPRDYLGAPVFSGPVDALAIELPKGNLASVTSVTYVDTSGATQTLSPSKYVVDTASVPGRILPAYGETWPATREQWDAVVVRYVIGWAQDAVPSSIKQALLLLISQMYEHRTPEIIGAPIAKVDFATDALLRPHRLTRF